MTKPEGECAAWMRAPSERRGFWETRFLVCLNRQKELKKCVSEDRQRTKVIFKLFLCLWMLMPLAAVAGSMYRDSDSLLANIEAKHLGRTQTAAQVRRYGPLNLRGSRQAGDYRVALPDSGLTQGRGYRGALPGSGPRTYKSRAEISWLDGRTRLRADRSGTQYSWRNLRRRDNYPANSRSPFASMSISR